MHKNQYRLLYNAARNQLMVVPEHASSKGGVSISSTSIGDSRASSTDQALINLGHAFLGNIHQYLGKLKHLSFAALRLLALPAVVVMSSASLATLSALSTLPAQAAELAVDASAPANQRPLLTNAANGVPVVNIQTPSAAGVSHNTYSQFDVGSQGVILNNGSTNVQTQLGGYIQGNPYLPGSTARVILNEVNSSNPSY